MAKNKCQVQKYLIPFFHVIFCPREEDFMYRGSASLAGVKLSISSAMNIDWSLYTTVIHKMDHVKIND